MMLVKFIFNVWEDKIVPKLSELPGASWPGFDNEKMMKAVSSVSHANLHHTGTPIRFLIQQQSQN